jgi:hypothetical protein
MCNHEFDVVTLTLGYEVSTWNCKELQRDYIKVSIEWE